MVVNSKMRAKGEISPELLTHIFFPKKLPESPSSSNIHQSLIQLVLEFAEQFSEEVLQIPKTKNLFSRWTQFHSSLFAEPPGENKIYKMISSLNDGDDMVALYLPGQNAGLFFATEGSDSVIVSAFEASCDSQSIMSSEGDLLKDFPEVSVRVPNKSSVLHSSDFGSILTTLSDTVFSFTQRKSKKANMTVDESRDVVDPMFVTDWISHLLCDESSKTVDPSEFPRIRKKIRDDVVLGNNVGEPFRRSGLWMVIKVALQTSFLREFGEMGNFIYKFFLLFLMGNSLQVFHEMYKNKAYESELTDSEVQFMRKIARRMVKLEKISQNERHRELFIQYSKILTEQLESINESLISKWLMIFQSPLSGKIGSNSNTIREAIVQKCDHILNATKTNNGSHEGVVGNPPVPFCPRRVNPSQFPTVQISSVHHEADFQLKEIENWIRLYLDSYSRPEFCSDIKQLMTSYSTTALARYKCDPLANSRLILSVLKCLQVLGKIAMDKYPLLKEHSSGVELSFMDRLLLPNIEDMQMAKELESHFKIINLSNRPSLISDEAPTKNSFAVIYAKECESMKTLRQEILVDTEKKIEEKRAEVIRVREECAELRRRIYSTSCDYVYDKYNARNEHSSYCARCYLERNLNSKLVSVSPYEKPLPEEEYAQFAVVFELQIPPEIAILRDMLYFFKTDILFSNTLHCDQGVHMEWVNSLVQHYSPCSTFTNVKLGSTTKLSTNTHYNNRISVDNSTDRFILNNGLNRLYHGTSLLGNQRTSVEARCTFKLSIDSEYKGMQWMLDYTSHTSNQVLANQCNCPPDVSIPEYIQFGNHRAGHLLQYRNLVVALSNGALSLKAEEVFSLLVQSMWQQGPKALQHDNTDWVRDSHKDLLDKNFTKELLEIVEARVDANEKKWSEPWSLCTLTTIVSRVLEVGNVNQEASALLKKCRRVACNWISTINNLIEKAQAHNAPESEVNTLKLKMVLSSLSALLSYNVSPVHINLVMSSTEDMEQWLEAISCLYNEVFWNYTGRVAALRITQTQEILMRIAIGISLSLEETMVKLISTNNDPLQSFSRNKWKVSQKFLKPWTQCGGPACQVYQCSHVMSLSDNSIHFLYLDILFGRFLVDGYPIGRLPESITRSLVYQRSFQKAEFRVQPSKNGNLTVFSSSFGGINYRFSEVQSEIIIQQEHDGVLCKLLPPELFGNDFPVSFFQNFSHWWYPKENCVLFCNKELSVEGFIKTAVYRLSAKIKVLSTIKQVPDRQLVSIHSSIFKEICHILQKIEPVEHIHVWQIVNSYIVVELTRRNLKFVLSEYGLLMSHEFPGMWVDLDQNIETLAGLANKLVITNRKEDSDEIYNRRVIVPHAHISISPRESHQSVSIDLLTLNSPKFFVFDVDRRTRCLKAGKSHSAWIYLAALHGATSSPLPDPLTGMNGTEMAFKILHQARVSSFQPYDPESHHILQQIASFSPFRKFYPKHLRVQQKIDWPSGLSSICTHEGYSIIVQKLIEVSETLKQLFSYSLKTERDNHKQKEDKKTTDSFLSFKHYWKDNSFQNSAAQLSREFYPGESKLYRYERTSLLGNREAHHFQTRLLSYLCESWLPPSIKNYDWKIIRSLLVTNSPLSMPHIGQQLQSPDLTLWERELTDIRSAWFDLYFLALEVGKNPSLRPLWSTLLSFMAFINVDFQQLLLLHFIAVKCQFFEEILPPDFSYLDPTTTFNLSKVKSAIQEHVKSFSRYGYSTKKEELEKEIIFNMELNADVNTITQHINNQWKPRVTDKIRITIYVEKVFESNAEMEVNKLIDMWYKNSMLDKFLEKVETVFEREIHDFTECMPELGPLSKRPQSQDEVRPPPDFHILNVLTQMEMPHIDCITEAETDYTQTTKMGINASCKAQHFDTVKEFQNCLQKLKHQSSKYWFQLENILNKAIFGSAALISAGLFPRLVPINLLPLLLELKDEQSKKLENISTLIGASCVYWTLEQKMIRCIKYIEAGPSTQVQLEREKETVGVKAWNPKEIPEWLLLELEMNMNIRPTQVKVAEAMLNPQSAMSSIMQLNMGEGKTSLIVPMLVCSIADGHQLCRVTVIKSIFETNVNSLRHTLGGLIDRKVYVIPCRRDVNFDHSIIQSIKETYQDCMDKKGVVVTLPEFRLSFKLKGYEFARNGKQELAKELIQIQSWLNENTRDVLDESDDILSVKYQLIYTVGDQLPIDGGELRWEITQKLLKQVQKRMLELQQTFGDAAIEYVQNEESKDNQSIFPPCRLLSPAPYPDLIKQLCQDFMDGKIIQFSELKEKEKPVVEKFLIDNRLTKNDIDQLLELSLIKDSDRNLEILLILAGYLRFGVLECALSKRWRVNYGVNVKGTRKIAVPFKAKDVASERTEFGHPDMAIILTQLSYYYSGLSDSQLMECFHILKNNSRLNPVTEYDRWIQNVPEKLVSPSVRHFDGLNLDDYEQRTGFLFPILRKSTAVIDFYLNTFVFPKECKQFAAKMTCTAWDLVSENQNKLTTGFSGTNDSQNLLPATITQNDLPELLDTNRRLEKILQRPENEYKSFHSGISSVEILESLCKAKIRVLLDCGALMLQLSNEEVAKKWLEIDSGSTLEAVIYFNVGNTLTVRDRLGQSCQFELSPYRERMNVCGVYLDDEHCRGTDLKFPRDSRAAVTLGSGLTRDKMVQACMRMRMLGECHTVTFWSSHEVHNKILAMRSKSECMDLSGSDVLEWAKFNSKKFEEDGMVYWTASASNYCRKMGAEIIFHSMVLDNNGDKILYKLGTRCSEAEVVSLKEMYCHARNQVAFSNVAVSWFNATKASILVLDGDETLGVDIRDEIVSLFGKVSGQCYERIRRLIPGKLHFSQLLDEEQEKELENEVEEETERQLPGPATPLVHKLTLGLCPSLQQGFVYAASKDILPISYVFKNTSVQDFAEFECWGDSVFCTQDFRDTIQKASISDTLTEFLRPVTWIAKLNPSNSLIAVSPFEANELITKFRTSKFKATLHLFSPRTLPSQNILIENSRLAVPSSEEEIFSFWPQLLPPLFLCSGNLYFKDELEQKTFSKFLGLIPRPRSEELQILFESGHISASNGFLAPQYRDFEKCPIDQNSFRHNPEKLVKTISIIRNQLQFPLDSHVAGIVINGVKNEKF